MRRDQDSLISSYIFFMDEITPRPHLNEAFWMNDINLGFHHKNLFTWIHQLSDASFTANQICSLSMSTQPHHIGSWPGARFCFSSRSSCFCPWLWLRFSWPRLATGLWSLIPLRAGSTSGRGKSTFWRPKMARPKSEEVWRKDSSAWTSTAPL